MYFYFHLIVRETERWQERTIKEPEVSVSQAFRSGEEQTENKVSAKLVETAAAAQPSLSQHRSCYLHKLQQLSYLNLVGSGPISLFNHHNLSQQ